MDPLQCFNDLTSAYIGQHWTECREHALNLLAWLAKGGFVPGNLRKEDVQGYCSIVERVCRNHMERGES